MRNRNHRVEIYFTKNELETLTKKVRRSGLSREGFCRRVLNGTEVKEAPPTDVPFRTRRQKPSRDRPDLRTFFVSVSNSFLVK